MNPIYTKARGFALELGAEEHIADSYAKIIVFLSQNNDRANYLGKGNPTDDAYVLNMASKFINSRLLQSPSMPNTSPDEIVGIILNEFFMTPDADVHSAIDYHMKAMGAENITGYLLERYIAQALEPKGWVWCSASIVRSVDFIKPDEHLHTWEQLQIKNRDNSENSSSSAIRNSTQIKKWHRTISKTGATNWENFPDEELCSLLSETDFHSFVRSYLASLRK